MGSNEYRKFFKAMQILSENEVEGVSFPLSISEGQMRYLLNENLFIYKSTDEILKKQAVLIRALCEAIACATHHERVGSKSKQRPILTMFKAKEFLRMSEYLFKRGQAILALSEMLDTKLFEVMDKKYVLRLHSGRDSQI